MLTKNEVESIARLLVLAKRFEVRSRTRQDSYGVVLRRGEIEGILEVLVLGLKMGMMFHTAIREVLQDFENDECFALEKIDEERRDEYVQRIVKVFAPRIDED